MFAEYFSPPVQLYFGEKVKNLKSPMIDLHT
jgi:hypothetical protein